LQKQSHVEKYTEHSRSRRDLGIGDDDVERLWPHIVKLRTIEEKLLEREVSAEMKKR
jgi:hypothetical protein